MQKQKLFKTFSCINSDKELLVYFGAEGPPTQPEVKKEEPKPAAESAGGDTEKAATDAGAKIVEKAKDEINLPEAIGKVAKSLAYLSIKQNIDIDPDQLVDVLKDQKFLDASFDSQKPGSDITVVEAIKAMQRKLGFEGKDVDGQIGKKTWEAISVKPGGISILLALNAEAKKKNAYRATGTLEGDRSPAASAAAPEATKETKPDLPEGEKAKFEVQLSQISDAIQVNYKTAERLYKTLFNDDGTFKQNINPNDLLAYKAAMDNLDAQNKMVNDLGLRLDNYNLPDGKFEFSVLNQKGESVQGWIKRHGDHTDFAAASLWGSLKNYQLYINMEYELTARLAELKGDYDRVVQEWAQKVAGKEGRTGDDAAWQELQKISDSERTPPVLALLGIKTEQFNADVNAEAGTILAKRNEKEDQEMASALEKAEKEQTAAQQEVAQIVEKFKIANGKIDIRQKTSHSAQLELVKAGEAVRLAESPTASEQEKKDLEAKRVGLADAKQYAENSLKDLEIARTETATSQRELAQAEAKLQEKTQALAALKAARTGGVAAAEK